MNKERATVQSVKLLKGKEGFSKLQVLGSPEQWKRKGEADHTLEMFATVETLGLVRVKRSNDLLFLIPFPTSGNAEGGTIPWIKGSLENKDSDGLPVVLRLRSHHMQQEIREVLAYWRGMLLFSVDLA